MQGNDEVFSLLFWVKVGIILSGSGYLSDLKIWDEVCKEKMRQQPDILLFSQLTDITKYGKRCTAYKTDSGSSIFLIYNLNRHSDFL